MYSLHDLDTDLFCMVMNKVEIMDKVVDELNTYRDDYDDDIDNAIYEACVNLGYNPDDLSDYDWREIKNRVM